MLQLGWRQRKPLCHAVPTISSGTLDFASAGNDSTHHLTMEYCMQNAGIKMRHVPYRGAAPAAHQPGNLMPAAGRLPALAVELP